MNLFTYGTLMFAEIMARVTGKSYRAQPATISGYGRYRIQGETYPGVTRKTSCFTDGVVYFDIDRAALARLDAFEGPLYTRINDQAILANGDKIPVALYIIPSDKKHLLTAETWSPDIFKANDLDAFIQEI